MQTRLRHLVMIAASIFLQHCVHEKFLYRPEADPRMSDLNWADSSLPMKKDAQILGRIHLDEKGSIFDSCPRMVERIYLRLADEARVLGASEVAGQIWFPGDSKTFTSARCKQRWYYLAVFFPLIFGPYFMSATVDAVAVK